MNLQGRMRAEVGRYFDLQGVNLTESDLQLLFDYVTDLDSFLNRELRLNTVYRGQARSNVFRFASDGTIVRSCFDKEYAGQSARHYRISKPEDVLKVLRLVQNGQGKLVRAKRLVAPIHTVQEPAAPVGDGIEEQTQAIKNLRQRLALTQQGLAELLGATQSQVWAWETGKTRMGPRYRNKLNELISGQRSSAR